MILETWVSNVEYARRFAAFHAPKGDQKNFFVFVGPRNSRTAANADLWVSVAPGDGFLIALGVLQVILDERLSKDLDQNRREILTSDLRSAWHLGGHLESRQAENALLSTMACSS